MIDMNPTNLYDQVVKYRRFDCRKHHEHANDEARDQCVEDYVDSLTPAQLLRKISEAFDELKGL